VGHASRSDGLLRIEASHCRVFQSGLKTSGGAMTGGARGIIVEVMWSSSRRRMGRYDGCVGPSYPYFTVFYVLDPMSVLVF
jgi:hypothetical protein